MTKGLPGSGKTTWAKEYQKKNPSTVLVNKDDLRNMLHQGVHSKGREKFVLGVRNWIIVDALMEGHDVIVHDTNLNPIHEETMRKFIEDINRTSIKGSECELVIQNFTNIPVEECIKNDAKRQSYVGEKVIRQMFNQYLRPTPIKIEYIPGVPRTILCDLDGTLALFGDANPYERDFDKDEINAAARYVLDGNDDWNTIVFVSGRSDKFKSVTETWLDRYGFGKYPLFMRKDGDVRKDVLVKKEIYETEIKGKYNVLFVLDDRNSVVEFWRSEGLTCLQVADGDF